jgi:hypothetical protein
MKRKDLNRKSCEFILRHLLPTEGITAKDLAQKTGLTPREVGWVARKLVLSGVILREDGVGFSGSGVIYYANL